MSKSILSATITLAVGTLFIAGCATKNYVKQSITPVDQKIDQVDKSSQSRDTTQVADINKTNQVVDENEKKLSATDEIAKTADGTANVDFAAALKDLNGHKVFVRDDYEAEDENFLENIGVAICFRTNARSGTCQRE